MRTKWVKRLTALLLVLVLPTASAARAYGVQHCPHHDGVHGAAVQSADETHQEHADHAGSSEASVAESQNRGSGDHEACTCVGPCQSCGTAAAVLPVAPEARVDAPSFVARPVVQQEPALRGNPTHTLPYATAPPSSC